MNLTGSQYFQALQVQKAIKLGGHKVDTKKIQYTLALTESYKAAEIDSKPKHSESHKIDFIA